jgi:hypothetical protein
MISRLVRPPLGSAGDDRDGRYPALFGTDLSDAGLDVVLSGARRPRMNSIMERRIQSCRHELFGRTLIFNQTQLRATNCCTRPVSSPPIPHPRSVCSARCSPARLPSSNSSGRYQVFRRPVRDLLIDYYGSRHTRSWLEFEVDAAGGSRRSSSADRPGARHRRRRTRERSRCSLAWRR